VDDNHKFCDAYEADIEKWCRYWSLNYFSITKGWLVVRTPTPSTIIIGAGAGPSTLGGGGNGLTIKAWVILTFNHTTEFFEELHTNY
jgi:hypothetical protein